MLAPPPGLPPPMQPNALWNSALPSTQYHQQQTASAKSGPLPGKSNARTGADLLGSTPKLPENSAGGIMDLLELEYVSARSAQTAQSGGQQKQEDRRNSVLTSLTAANFHVKSLPQERGGSSFPLGKFSLCFDLYCFE